MNQAAIEAAKAEFRDYTPEQARIEIERLKASPEFWAKKGDGGHPSFNLSNAVWSELHRIGHPEPPKKESKTQ